MHGWETGTSIMKGCTESSGASPFNLPGPHQVINATTALGAMEVLEDLGYTVSTQAMMEGLRVVEWPGRLEMVSSSPRVVLDGAHNPAGALVLKESLEKEFHFRRLILLIGILKDKDIQGILRTLSPLADHIILSRPHHRTGSSRQRTPEGSGTEWKEGRGRGTPRRGHSKRTLHDGRRGSSLHHRIPLYGRRGQGLFQSPGKGHEDLSCVIISLFLVFLVFLRPAGDRGDDRSDAGHRGERAPSRSRRTNFRMKRMINGTRVMDMWRSRAGIFLSRRIMSG